MSTSNGNPIYMNDPMSVHQPKDLEKHPVTLTEETKKELITLLSKENTPKWGKKLPIKSGWYIGCANKLITFKWQSWSQARTIPYQETFPLHIKTWNMQGKRKYSITMSYGVRACESLRSLIGPVDIVLPLWHKEPWKDILISQQPLSSLLLPPVEGELLAFDSSIDIASIESEIIILKSEIGALAQVKAIDVSSLVKELQTKVQEKEQKIIKLKGETILAPSTPKPKPKKVVSTDDDILI